MVAVPEVVNILIPYNSLISFSIHQSWSPGSIALLMLLMKGLLEELQHGLGQRPVDFGLGDKRVEISRSHCVV